MADMEILAATPREKTGKGAARATRRAGLVPAVIYGGGEPPVAIAVEARELVRRLNAGGFFNTLFDVRVEGASNRALPRELQVHPVTDAPEHLDFLRVSAGAVVTVEVPVEFAGEEECPGLRAGGVLNIVRHAIEVSCTPDRIPAVIRVDLSGVPMGASVHIGAVALPEGVTPTITDRDFTVATIAAPTVAAAEAGEAEEGDDEDDADDA